jgi:hypothetical protein
MKKAIVQILAHYGSSLEAVKSEGFIHIEHPPFMDLNIDYLGKKYMGRDTYSIAHNYLQNGDVMADPDMEFVDMGELGFTPITYQQAGLGVFQQCLFCENGQMLINPRLSKALKLFANQWARNLRELFLP